MVTALVWTKYLVEDSLSIILCMQHFKLRSSILNEKACVLSKKKPLQTMM